MHVTSPLDIRCRAISQQIVICRHTTNHLWTCFMFVALLYVRSLSSSLEHALPCDLTKLIIWEVWSAARQWCGPQHCLAAKRLPSLDDFLRQFSFTLTVSELPVWWQDKLIQTIKKNYFNNTATKERRLSIRHDTAGGVQWGRNRLSSLFRLTARFSDPNRPCSRQVLSFGDCILGLFYPRPFPTQMFSMFSCASHVSKIFVCLRVGSRWRAMVASPNRR
jgi:hypothetical protein